MKPADILVIGGTADSRKIIRMLCDKQARVLVAVATSYGAKLLPSHSCLQVHEGRLDMEKMVELIKQSRVKCLIDASHPYAELVSCNAISACQKTSVPYLRYERPQFIVEYEKIIEAETIYDAVLKLEDIKGNILLAVGSKDIQFFASSISDYNKRLFVRVLPQSEVLLKCEKAGLTADNLIAMKGPFSIQMNIEIIKHCKASVLVTKDSGEEGGFAEKIYAAKEMDIPVILIKRPLITYPQKTCCIDKVIDFAEYNVFQR